MMRQIFEEASCALMEKARALETEQFIAPPFSDRRAPAASLVFPPQTRERLGRIAQAHVLLAALVVLASIGIGATMAAADHRADDQRVIARRDRLVPPLQHYYPTTGVKPKIGRDEDLSAPSSTAPQPDTSYRRQY